MLSGVSGPAFDESAELTAENMASVQGQASNSRSATPKPLEMPVQRQPLSPKSLAPLIIPHSSAPLPRLAEQDSKGDETPGPVVPPKSARMLEFSPSVKSSASKPSPAPATAPSAVATSIFSAKAQAKQPNSAPSDRSSPQPWSATLNFSPYSQGRSQTPDNGNVFSHRRGASEGTYSVMDRGRPKRRLDASPSSRMHSASVSESTSEDRKAFEALPQSSTPAVASASMSAEEIADLRKQAIGQATRFGVLSPKDVDKLSRVRPPNPPYPPIPILYLLADCLKRSCAVSMRGANTFARPSATLPRAAKIFKRGSACISARHASHNSHTNHY